MELLRKFIDAEIETKDADGKPAPIVVTATTGDEDRDGDVIDPKGWDVADYERNPVILWAHDSKSLPIGIAEKVKQTAKGIKLQIKFASHQKAQEVEAAVREGIVRGVSVGFKPTTMPEMRGAGGLKFSGQKLLEVSLVPVPSNASALVESKAVRDEIFKSISAVVVPPAAEVAAKPPPQAAMHEEKEMSEEKKTEATPVVDVAAIAAEAAKKAVEEFAKSMKIDPTAKAVEDAASKAPHITKYGNKPQIEKTGPEASNVLVGRVAIAAARAKKIGCTVKDALTMYGHRSTADKMESEETNRKALGISSMAYGGAVVPEDNVGQMIELLSAQSMLIGAPGVTMLYPNTDVVRIPRQTGGATATYIGEATAITPSSQTFDQLELKMKKLSAMTVVSNEFLADAAINAEAFVGNDLLRVAALKMDLAAFTGTGTVYEPMGIANALSSAHSVQQTGTTYANWITDLNRTVSDLETDNVPLAGSMYFLNPRTKNGLFGLQDSDGNFVFRDEMKGGTLNGFPFRVTTQITTTGAACRVYFVNLPNFIVAMRKEFEIAVGETYDSSGTVKSAFAEDQSVIRLIGRHDFALRHPEAASIIHTVTLA